MDNATFQTPISSVNPPTNVPEAPEVKTGKKHKGLWVISILIVAGLAVGLILIYGKEGLYKGQLKPTDATTMLPATRPTEQTSEQQIAGKNAIKASDEAKTAAAEAKQASQEAAGYAAKAEEARRNAEEAKTEEDAAAWAAQAEEYENRAKEARNRAFTARDKAFEAKNNARAAAYDTGISAGEVDQFLDVSGTNAAAESVVLSAEEAQASVLRAEQSADAARQFADQKAQQAAAEEEKPAEKAGEKPPEVAAVPVGPAIVPVGPAAVPVPGKTAVSDKKPAADGEKAPIAEEQPQQESTQAVKLQNEVRSLLAQAESLDTQEEKQKATDNLLAGEELIKQAMQAAKAGDMKKAEQLFNEAKKLTDSAATIINTKQEAPPPSPPEQQQSEIDRLRQELANAVQTYRDAISRGDQNISLLTQQINGLRDALAQAQAGAGQPVNVTVQLPQVQAPSCPSGFNYDASRNVCIQTQTQEVVVSRSGAGGTSAAATPSSVTSTAPAREVVLGRTQPPSREIQAEEEEEAQTRELEEAARAAADATAAEKPTAKAKAAGEEGALRGAYIEGRIAGETGPGLLVYPAILAGANLLYYLRKRKKK